MRNLFILLLLPLVLTACGGEAKVQTQDGFKTAQNWTEFRDNGVTFYVIGSSNYKVIDGHPIALGLNFATKGQNSMVYATLWNAGVTEPINCSFDGDKVTISVDNSSTTFSNCEYKSDDSRNEADIIISTDDREAKTLYNKIIDADKFSITVTLQGGNEFTYEFTPDPPTKTTSTSQQSAAQQSTPSVVGVYVVNDGAHDPLYVTVNPDGSAVIAYESNYGKEKGQFYGSWRAFDGRSDAAVFTFEDDHYSTPRLRFNFDFDNPKTSLAGFVIADGYMYYDYNAARAKNPKLRLEATKK